MCVCEVGRESFCRVILPMGGKKSKHDSTANGEGQVSALTFYINDLEALQTWNSMGEEAKLQYDHVHIAFKLAPKNANEINKVSISGKGFNDGLCVRRNIHPLEYICRTRSEKLSELAFL